MMVNITYIFFFKKKEKEGEVSKEITKRKRNKNKKEKKKEETRGNQRENQRGIKEIFVLDLTLTLKGQLFFPTCVKFVILELN